VCLLFVYYIVPRLLFTFAYFSFVDGGENRVLSSVSVFTVQWLNSSSAIARRRTDIDNIGRREDIQHRRDGRAK
jgi:hypothetical protein